jgi:hypothetical protein
MSSLLGFCEGGTHELYNEIDHIITLAANLWQKRTGGHGTRDVLVQEKKVCFLVGIRPVLNPGPSCEGGNSTPKNSPCRSSPTLSSRAQSSRAGSSRSRKMMCDGVRLGPPESRGGSKPSRPLKEIVQEIFVPEYIIAEIPKLLEMYRATAEGSSKCTEVGPIERSARLFGIVVGLCKLRWLVKLHYALVSLCGNRGSLQRTLVGALTDCCSIHQWPHGPFEIYELLVGTLQTRFQQGWPLFLAWIGSIDHSNPDESSRCDRDPCMGPRPFTAPASGTENGFARAYQPEYHPKAFQGKDAHGLAHSDPAAFLWQIVDDMFIAWIVQQDPIQVPAEKVWKELDFYGVPLPAVKTNLAGLIAWCRAPNPGSKTPHVRAAQRQAHHLAVILELPLMRPMLSASDDEILELAREVVAHPRTFNAELRSRIAMVLQGRDELIGQIDHSCAVDMDGDQLSQYLSHSADARDAGRLNPGQLQTLRDSSAPWLAAGGREARFQAAARAWPHPAPRPGYLQELNLKKSKPNMDALMSQMISLSSPGRYTPNTPIWR